MLTNESEHQTLNLLDLLAECTVRVENVCGKSTATGFFVAPGQVLTCRHTVDRGADPEIAVTWRDHEFTVVHRQDPVFPPASSEAASITGSSTPDFDAQILDAVLLTVAGPDGPRPPCILLDSAVKIDDRLYAFGYSDGAREGQPSKMRALHFKQRSRILKVVDGQVLPGMSGAPVLNLMTGSVCGLIQESLDPLSDLGGFVVPAQLLMAAFPGIADRNAKFHETNKVWIKAAKAAGTLRRSSYLERTIVSASRHLWSLKWYLAALAAAGLGLANLNGPLERLFGGSKSVPFAVAFLPLATVFLFETVPDLARQVRERRLREWGINGKPGPARLFPHQNPTRTTWRTGVITREKIKYNLMSTSGSSGRSSHYFTSPASRVPGKARC